MPPKGSTAAASKNLPVPTRQLNFPAVLEHWQAFTGICQSLAKSGKCGELRSQESILAVAIQGAELGFPPMTAVNMIYPISGKLSISSQGMKAIVHRDFPGAKFTTLEETPTACSIKLEIPGRGEETAKFTMDDAKKAGLVKKDSNWDKFPGDMLYWRCIAKVCRRLVPDALCGMYAPDELDSSIVDVDWKPIAETTPASASANGVHKPEVEPATPPASTAPITVPTPAPSSPPANTDQTELATPSELHALKQLYNQLSMAPAEWKSLLNHYGVSTANDLPRQHVGALMHALRNRVKNQQDAPASPAPELAGAAAGN